MSCCGKTPVISLFLILLSFPILGQRFSEKEINIQKIFIDAHGERLIGNFDKAIALYEEVLKKDKTNHAAAYELARIYDATSRNEEAIKSLKMSILIAPSNIWYQQFLAEVYEKTGQFSESAQLYQGLAKAYPNNENYYFKWAFYLVKANSLDKAIKAYDALEKQKGINEETIRRKHALYLGSGDNKKAGKELQKLINAFPQQVRYRLLLANFYDQVGDRKNAESVYKDVLEIDSDNAKAKLALSGNGAGKSKEGQYLNALKPVFEQEEVNIDLKLAKLFPLINKVANDNDAALADQVIQLTDILERVHPGNAKGFAAAGDLYYHSDRSAQALPKYLQTLELDETVFAVWENVMYIHYEDQAYEALSKVSEEVMDIFPNKAIIYYLNGLSLSQLGKAEDAIDALDQALLMVGQDGKLKFDILNQIGEAYNAEGNHADADDAFTKALALNDKSAMTYLRYAKAVAIRTGQGDRSKSLAKNGLDLAPKIAIVQAEYGRVFYLLEDYENARKWIDKALAGKGAEDPKVLEYYGDLLFSTDAIDEAINYWTKAQEKGNRSATLERKIAERKLLK